MASTTQFDPSIPGVLQGPHAPRVSPKGSKGSKGSKDEGYGAAEQEHESIAKVLESLVGETAKSGSDALTPATDSHAPTTPGSTSTRAYKDWWERFFPSEERVHQLFADYHMGNYVAIRGRDGQPGAKIFESMPIYVRVGMHLLFYGSKEQSFLRYDSVDHLLQEASLRQGRIYDDTSDPSAVLAHIRSFVSTYAIDTSELAQPDLTQYPSFNTFFYRQLRPDARPIPSPGDQRIVSSSADCRLTVFEDVQQATQIWIKGRNFDTRHLLSDTNLADRNFPPGSALAVFRLAPADYHRFHHPVGPAIVGPTRHVAGEYYTVNPQAVNEDFDVFTTNRRDVVLLDWAIGGGAGDGDGDGGGGEGEDRKSVTVAVVAVGAMLVGSIGWTNANQGAQVKRGQEMGYFAYGGSTVIAIFPPSARIQWDADLLSNSQNGLETMVRVGERIGRAYGGLSADGA